jgi:hypothetical protein
MIWPFDIFRVQDDGHVLWLEAVASLQDAKSRVESLILDSEGKFIVLNQVTGTRYHFPESIELPGGRAAEKRRAERN